MARRPIPRRAAPHPGAPGVMSARYIWRRDIWRRYLATRGTRPSNKAGSAVLPESSGSRVNAQRYTAVKIISVLTRNSCSGSARPAGTVRVQVRRDRLAGRRIPEVTVSVSLSMHKNCPADDAHLTIVSNQIVACIRVRAAARSRTPGASQNRAPQRLQSEKMQSSLRVTTADHGRLSSRNNNAPMAARRNGADRGRVRRCSACRTRAEPPRVARR